MARYSALSLLKNALTGRDDWGAQWPSPEPKAHYDVIIVGAGGHGLGAAYYLAKEHGITNVAVIDKGWLGGGNTGRNTTIIRSNYLYDESARLYDHALDLWEGPQPGTELQRHVLAARRDDARPQRPRRAEHEAAHQLQPPQRRRQPLALGGGGEGRLPAAQRLAGRALSGARRSAPVPRRHRPARRRRLGLRARRPRRAASTSSRTARSLSIRRGPDGRVTGVETAKGFIGAGKVAVSAAGHTSVVMETAGVRMPLESFPLQALVSEPVKPCFPCVVMSNAVHAYISQSDKGELVIGSGTDQYTSYSQRGGFPMIEHTLAAICEMFPVFSRMRMLRSWGGIVDVTPDRSAILGKTPVPGLYVNCGWGTGGFKATPGAAHVLAHTVAKDEPHPINAPVHAGALHHRPPDRRGGRRRGGALMTPSQRPEPCHASDPLPLLRGDAAGGGVHLRRRGAHRPPC